MSDMDPFKLLDKWFSAGKYVVVGKSVSRSDSLEKLLGRAKFVEDYFEYGRMLFVKQVLSSESHALIMSIDYSRALRIPGIERVVTYKDIPGESLVGYTILDRPLIAGKKVRYHGEPVALVAGWDIDRVLAAAEEVRVEYKPLKPVLDPLEAMSDKTNLVHEENESNIAFKTRLRRGSIEDGFSRSDVVVENVYKTHHQEHAYLEPEAALAIPREEEVTVIGCTHDPYLTQYMVARVLGIPASRVKVVVPYIGGSFGGKSDEGPLVAAKAALVAYLTGKPAFLMYTREESIRIHPKRGAVVVKYRSGASFDGELQAIKVEIVFDTGAYVGRCPSILWRATVHASGPYRVPNAWVDGYCVYTNKVPQGSFRGSGNLSIHFAVERQMDELARELGFDPVEFRLFNMLKPGMETITGEKLGGSTGVYELVDRLAKSIDWYSRRRMIDLENRGRKRFKRGLGIGVAWHGIGFGLGDLDWSNALVRVERDGSITVYTSTVELGQGSPVTSYRQVVAEVLGVPLDLVRIVWGTTDAPDTGATRGSRGTCIGAIGVFVAASRIRERLSRLASNLLKASPEEIVFRDGRVFVDGREEKCISWSDLVREAYAHGIELTATGHVLLPRRGFSREDGQGTAYPAYSFAVAAVEVEVDTYTGRVRILKLWPGLAAGKIIDPVQVECQIEGAIAQGVGYVLMEELFFGSKGEILNTDLSSYVIPVASDLLFDVEKPVYVEDLFEHGVFGAKGVGEVVLIPIPAAIANAVSHALGVKVNELPLTPMKILEILRSSRGG